MHRFFLFAFSVSAPLLVAACGGEETEVCPTATPTRCADACVDPMSSRAHCGACGTTCGDSEVCLDGACMMFCPTGQMIGAGGTCVNLDSDPLNCGAVGTACAPGEVCAAGACALTCTPPAMACGASCADVSTDPSHCGACDTICDPGLACHEGACIDPCDGLPTTDGQPLATLNMIVPYGNVARIKHAYIISEALRELGIVGIVQRVTFGELVGRGNPATSEPGINGFDLFFIGRSATTPRPINETLSCGNPRNFMKWCNAEFDDAVRTYETSLNRSARDMAVRRMQEAYVDDQPNFFLYFISTVWGLPGDLATFDGQYGVSSPQVWTGLSNVVIALPVAPDGTNPLFTTSVSEDYFVHTMFERLFVPDSDPMSPTHGEAQPQLAAAIPGLVATGSGTEHSVTVDLRASRFSDGHPVDAYDVAFSLQLLLLPSIDSSPADDIRTLGLTFDGIEVVDADTIRLVLPEPAPDFPFLLGVPIVPMHYWLPHTTTAEAATAYTSSLDATGYIGPVPLPGDAFDDGSETFGSGPYMAAAGGRWDATTGTILLTENPMSATPTSGVTDVTMRVLSIEDVRSQLAAGASLLVHWGYAFRSDDLSGFAGVREFENTTLGFQEMGPNLDNPLLADLQVRRAIDLAIPRQRIVDEALGGVGTIAHTWISPASPFHDPDFAEGGPFGPVFDPSAARATMRSAGYMQLDADAPALQTTQARMCSAERALEASVEAGDIDRATADRILADVARAAVGR